MALVCASLLAPPVTTSLWLRLWLGAVFGRVIDCSALRDGLSAHHVLVPE